MDFKSIVAITGMPGLYKAVSQRSDGMIVTSLETNETKFVPNRTHGFTALDGISIFTRDGDSKDIKSVFKEMLQQEATNPPIDVNAANDAVKKYFKSILPDYDEERVYVSDMKKVIKWFYLLKKENLLSAEEAKEATKEEKS